LSGIVCSSSGPSGLRAFKSPSPFDSAVNMPSASTSTFRIPTSSMSSLSHSMTVRSGIEAFSMGTISHRGPRVITMPPVCWLR
jgi:hypothetical protein